MQISRLAESFLREKGWIGPRWRAAELEEVTLAAAEGVDLVTTE